MKRIFSVMLVVMMVFSLLLAGCGGNTAAVGKTETTTQQAASTQPPATTNASPVPITFTMFVNHTWFWVDNFGGRPVDDEITKRTGVSLQITKAADANQIATLVASGELPDLIYTYRKANLLTNPELCYTWPELIAKYAPDFKISPFELAVNSAPDGNVYTVRNMYFTPEEWNDPKALPGSGLGSIEVRQDMMDKMGLPPIQNLTDFENALIKEKKTFPGTTPLLLIMGDIGLQYFYQIFGMTAGSTNLYEDNGQIKFRINHPAFKETLQYMNKLYREGLISAEMLTYKAEQSTAVMDSGKLFSAAGFATSADSDNAKYKTNKIEGTWAQLPVMLSDKVSYTDDSAGWAGVFVTKKCKDPGRAIKFLQFMKSEEGSKLTNWGIEGQQYTPDKDGYPVFTQAYKDVFNKGNSSEVTVLGISAWQFCASGKYEGIRNFNPDMPTTLKCLQDWKKVYQFKPWFQQIIPQVDTDENNVYTKLNQLASDSEIQLIVQKTEADFNKKFDEMMKKAEDSGMKDFEKLLTDRYTEVIKRYKN